MTDMEAFEAKWAALRLKSPDPSAMFPSSTSSIRLYHYLTLIPYYILIGPLTIYWSLKWLFTPSFPGWTYSEMRDNRRNRFYSILNSFYLQQAEPESTRWDHKSIRQDMKDLYDGARERGEIETEVVKLYPVSEAYKKGIGKGEWVREGIVPGFWISPRGSKGKGEEKAKKGEKVILHVHGGGYVAGHPWWNPVPLAVAKRTKARLLSVNYRKPLNPEVGFPAPLLDVLSGFLHLTQDLGFEPSQIIMLGKSAGGHLIFMLSRYLHNLGRPQPRGIAIMAPWCDFKLCQPSYSRHSGYDVLNARGLKNSVKASMRWFDPKAIDDVYFNPVSGEPEDWKYLKEEGVKVYMMVGTRELFEDEVKVTAGAMRRAGVDVKVTEDLDGLHTSAMWVPERLAVFTNDIAEMMGV